MTATRMVSWAGMKLWPCLMPSTGVCACVCALCVHGCNCVSVSSRLPGGMVRVSRKELGMTDLRPLSFGDHVSLFEILDHHKWYARTPGCKSITTATELERVFLNVVLLCWPIDTAK